MQTRRFGRLGEVSALTLGGGGLGGGWGPTSREEAVATIEAAVEAGITMLDVAPSYETPDAPREAEQVIGAAFGGRLPSGVRILTKVSLEDYESRDVIRASVEESLHVMQLERIDILLHHAFLRPDRLDYIYPTLSLRLYREVVRDEFEKLREEGLIGAWGLTAIGHPEGVAAAFAEDPQPQVIQAVTNLLDSPGSLWTFEGESPDNAGTRSIARAANAGVMGIRAVQGGALTSSFDRQVGADDPEQIDFDRAAGFRELAAKRGDVPAVLAYRYALSMPEVDTLVLGVKNRVELAEGLAAEEAGPVTAEEMSEIERSVGRT